MASLTVAAAQPPAQAADWSATTDRFCTLVQQELEGTQLASANVVHGDYEAFKKSKAEAKPLRTEQFVLYRDEAAKTDPLRISCKSKTADQLNELYGPGTARGSGTCDALHRKIVAAVVEGLTADERAALKIQPQDIVYEPDDVTVMGSKWVEPYTYAWIGADGRLHLKSKALLAEWTNILFKMAPDQFRGTHYCHLIAPEHLRAVMLGTSELQVVEAR